MVDHQKVSFTNRYGISLTGDFYLPKGATGPLPALVVSGPFGAVKEQSSGLYAQTMAERGFATLAFDPSFTGESGGSPCNVASPDINTEDFSAAVDYIGLRPEVDRERIGVIGICGWGGMALNAVASDKRVKAVVASTMYDMTRVMSMGYNDSVTPEQRAEALEQLSRQRWTDAENGAPTYQPAYNELHGGEPQFAVDYHDYYATPRGYHPRADAQQNRDKILAAAEEIFLERGASVSMNEVARHAGVGIGTLYPRFPTREDLLAAAYSARFIAFAEDLRGRAKAEDAVSVLRAYLEELVHHTTVYRGFAASLGIVLKTGTPGCIATTEVGQQLLRAAQASGRVRADVTFDDLVCIAMAISLWVEQNDNLLSRIAHLVSVFTEGVIVGLSD